MWGSPKSQCPSERPRGPVACVACPPPRTGGRRSIWNLRALVIRVGALLHSGARVPCRGSDLLVCPYLGSISMWQETRRRAQPRSVGHMVGVCRVVATARVWGLGDVSQRAEGAPSRWDPPRSPFPVRPV